MRVGIWAALILAVTCSIIRGEGSGPTTEPSGKVPPEILDGPSFNGPISRELLLDAYSADAIGLLSSATRVESFRIKIVHQHKGRPPTTAWAGKLGRFVITGRGKDQGRNFVVKFAEAAFDCRSYRELTMGCFDPGVGLRFWKDKESVDVAICFHCGKMRMKVTGSDKQDELDLNLSPTGFAKFAELAKEAFPDDGDIQKLRS